MNATEYKWNDMECVSSPVKSPKGKKGKHKQSPLKVKPLMIKVPTKKLPCTTAKRKGVCVKVT